MCMVFSMLGCNLLSVIKAFNYRGIPIEQFTQSPNFIEVAWLLIFGSLPTTEEYATFVVDLRRHADLDEGMKHHFEGFPRNAPPMAILRGPVGNRQRLDAAIPVVLDTDIAPATERGVQLGRTYEGNVIRVTHTGPYDGLGLVHRKIASYLAATGLERNGDPWEIYVSDPTRTPANERVTEIVYPVLIY